MKIASKFQLSALGECAWEETLHDIAAAFHAKGAALAVFDPANGVAALRAHGQVSSEIGTFAELGAGQVHAGCNMLGMRLSEAALVCFLDAPAEDDTAAAFETLVPGVEQALALGALVEREAVTQAALLEALARKADGIVLLDNAGRPSFLNEAASAILARGDGLCERDGQLCTARLPETRRLQRIIAERGHDRMLVSRRGNARPYVLHCLPVPAAKRFLTVRIIARVLHIHDLDGKGASPEALTAIFGLTDREAALAAALSRRGQLGQAATDARMAYNTARNHLQSIFRKTGTTSQVEVAQLLARLP